MSAIHALLVLLALWSAAGAAALVLPTRVEVPDVRVRGSGPAPGLAGGPGPPEWSTGPRGPVPWLRVVGAVAVAVGAAAMVGHRPGIVAGAVAGVGCWWATGRMEPPGVRRRRERLSAALPLAVDLMAACLGVGLSPSAALEQVRLVVDEPLAGELATVTARLRLGVDPVAVWRELSGHPQLGPLGRTLARAAESGASVSEAMLRLAEDLRRRRRAQVEMRARAVGVKAAVPLGVCLLPAFLLVGVVPLLAGSLSLFLP